MLSELFIAGVRRKKRKSCEGYVYRIPAIRRLGCLAFSRPVTFFVGENGSGKSTLLEAIAVNCGFNPEGGSRNFQFSSNDTHSDLYRDIAISKGVRRPRDGFFLRAESFYNVATEVDRLDQVVIPGSLLLQYGGRSLHQQSHGESFFSLMLHRFSANGLYLLDEPEAALSPANQMAMLVHLHHLVEMGSQFFIATHSPILMAYPNAEIYLLSERGIAPAAYEQTEHYQLTKQFLENPKQMLHYLLQNGPDGARP